MTKSIFSYFPDIARTSKMFYTLYIIEKSGKKAMRNQANSREAGCTNEKKIAGYHTGKI